MRLFRHPNEVTPECRGAAIALGNFDGVHLGHQAVIARAFELAQAYDSAVGILTFEPHPRAFFRPGQPPFRLTPFRIKMRVLQALGQDRDMGLDFVCCLAFDQHLASMTAPEFAQAVLHDGLNAAHIVTGEDFCFGKGRSGDVKTLKALGQTLKFGVDAVSAAVDGKGAVHSSTLAREHLQAGEQFIINYTADTAEIYWLAGDTEKAIAMLQPFRPGRTLELAIVLAAAGRYQEAAAAIREMPASNYPPGMTEGAAKILESAPAKAASPESLPRIGNMSFAYRHVGAPERVLEFYEDEVRGNYFQPISATWFWHPTYEAVRMTARFKTVMRDFGFVDYWRARGWPAQCRAAGPDDFTCD